MLHTISNGQLTAEISSVGAELMSIKDSQGTEYLWQGNPEYWGGRAYNLFPIVGRLFEGKYTYQGKTYEMPLHGFLRKTDLKVQSSNAHSITFYMEHDQKTLAIYPFEFRAEIKFVLQANKLTTVYTAHNIGNEQLIYTFGGHPGFNVPFCPESGAFEDYYLEFPHGHNARQLTLSPTCFMSGEHTPANLEDGRILRLKHSLFDNDAMVFKDLGASVVLRSVKGGPQLTMEFGDMPYFGLWHKPHSDAPFVCLEPWCALPSYDGRIDDFATKEGMSHLSPGKSASVQFSLTIES